MINSPSENISLELKQLQQLEIFERKLASLKSDIVISTKDLNALSNDTIRISKDNIYQQGLLDETNVQLVDAQKRINELNESHVLRNAEMSEKIKSIDSLQAHHTEKHMELKNREDTVSKKEQEIFSAQESLTERQLDHEEKEARFKIKVARLDEVISSF